MANFPLPKGYQRLDGFPLDETEIFTSDASAIAYAISPSAYAGQKISVVKDASNSADVYVILPDGSLGSIGSGGSEGEVLFKSGTGDYSVEQINSGNTNQSISEGSVTFGKNNLTGGIGDTILTDGYFALEAMPDTIGTIGDPTGYSEFYTYDDNGILLGVGAIISATPDMFAPGVWGLSYSSSDDLSDTDELKYVVSAPLEQKYGFTSGENNINSGEYSFIGGSNNINKGGNSFTFGNDSYTSGVNSFTFGDNALGGGSGETSLIYELDVEVDIVSGDYRFDINFINNIQSLPFFPNTIDLYDDSDVFIKTYDVSLYNLNSKFFILDTTDIFVDETPYIIKATLSNVVGQRNITIGKNTLTGDSDSLAIGNTTSALAENSYSIGNNNINTGTNSVVIGSFASTIANDSVAIGYGSHVTDYNGVAIGYSTASNSSIAINGEATGDQSLALLFGEAAGAQSLAIGNIAVHGQNAVGIGSRSTVNADYSINISNGRKYYRDNVLDGEYSTIIGGYGHSTDVSSNESTILGGHYHIIQDAIQSAIIGGDNITATQSNMVYVPALMLATGTTPTAPEEGTIYFNGTDKHFYGYNGTAWIQLDN